MRTHLDWVRKALIFEPRGHYDMYGCVITPPVTETADLGVLFLHNEGYSSMCGHGIIGVVTALFETGALPVQGPQMPVHIDTPAGLVRATAHLSSEGHVDQVSFLNVPSYLYKKDLTLNLPKYGKITFDIAFGGAFYAILDVKQLGLRVDANSKNELIAVADQIKSAVQESIAIDHPLESELGFLYGSIFVDTPEDPNHHSRNVCVFAEGEVDRSPTGTGVSARVALHHARGELEIGNSITIESILGAKSIFEASPVETVKFGPHNAVVPKVTGRAHITGRHEFIIAPEDPLKDGLLI